MAWHAQTKPDKLALVFEDENLSFGQLWQKVERLSGFFNLRLGNSEQKVVAILLPNSVEFVITYLAAVHAGHIVMPLDPAYKPMQLQAMVELVEPKLIISNDRYASQLGEKPRRVIMVNKLLSTSGPKTEPLRLPADDQMVSLTFTSGTSGRPKIAPNTHTNHLWNVKVCGKVWHWNSRDNLLISLPLSHWYGLVMGLSAAVYHGNTLHLTDQSLDVSSTLQKLASGQISIYSHVPHAYAKILSASQDRQYDLSKVRLLISGGAPLPPTVSLQFKKRFGVDITETYGSSETGRIAANRLDERLTGSPGKILPGVKFKLSPEGEVLVRSSGVFPGYWQDPAMSRQAKTSDGYQRTGDIAELKNGYLILKGRAQEKIRRYGYSISPRDIEWAMYQNPEIKEIHVIGRRSKTKDDQLVYFIVSDLSDEDILAYAKQNLVFAWRPDQLVRLSEIPRTLSGKPRLQELRDLAHRLEPS